MDECRRSGHIPAFGNWDLANHLPITQYFESATQAGLLPPSSSSSAQTRRHLHAPPIPSSLHQKVRGSNVVKENMMNTRRQGKVWDARPDGNGKVAPPPPRRPKPVDQDLYQIPPELLRNSKRSKMLGFISKCLLPSGCVS